MNAGSTADVLDKISDPIVASYTARTKVKDAKVREMMTAETWMTAEEAVKMGFADSVDKAQFVTATAEDKHMVFNGLDFDMSQFRNFDSSRLVLSPKSSTPPPQPAPQPAPTNRQQPQPTDPQDPPPAPPDPIDYSEYESAMQNTQAVLDQA